MLFLIRKKDGHMLPVCAATFQGISGMSKDKLYHLANTFHATGRSPIEKRGGDRSTVKDKEITQAIKNHIETYKCRESHYARNKSRRRYLPSEFSTEFRIFVIEERKNVFPYALGQNTNIFSIIASTCLSELHIPIHVRYVK
ncbi:hypothetical protein C0J52_05428 [Blattella germanica]|nr:hypothetical protein C0J52_05428 [Blattella germanica]